MATDPAARPDQAGDGTPTSLSTLAIPVLREELRVGTRRADSGRGVRIHKSVQEREHQVDAALLHDAVSVKRVSIDRIVALSEAPLARQEGDTLIVPVLEEVLVTEKRMRIKEELHITRTQSTRQHHQTVVLRAEHVDVERFDDGAGAPGASRDPRPDSQS